MQPRTPSVRGARRASFWRGAFSGECHMCSSRAAINAWLLSPLRCKGSEKEVRNLPYSSFALIVIFAFSTLETGHPFSAASAYF